MNFDWQAFCDKNGIPYVTRGANTAAGNISIKCPFCGDADHSEHMGLSLDTRNPVWGCWRNQMHRSKNPAVLVARLMGWSLEQAISLVESQRENPDDFAKALSDLQSPSLQNEIERPKALEMPKEFRKFDGKFKNAEHKFLEYLIVDRGLARGNYLSGVIKHFDLRYCVSGDYAERVIIPVYQNGRLLSWTARALYKRAVIRYKSLEDKHSVVNIKDSLLQRRGITINPQSKTLVLVEGPFDAIKVDCYGYDHGLVPMALFGMTISETQMALLLKFAKKFKQIAVMLDSTAAIECDTLSSQLKEYLGDKVLSVRLPEGVKDPGDLRRSQVEAIAAQLDRGD